MRGEQSAFTKHSAVALQGCTAKKLPSIRVFCGVDDCAGLAIAWSESAYSCGESATGNAELVALSLALKRFLSITA